MRKGRINLFPIKGRTLKPNRLKGGHLQVTLVNESFRQGFLVHRLVAEAFIPNTKMLPCVLHSDDDPSNNQKTNLRWGTDQDNTDDKIARKRLNPVRGSKVRTSVLSEVQVKIIKKRLRAETTVKILAKEFGVSESAINAIRTGRNWVHI